MYDLTPEEIVSLDKIQRRRIDDAVCANKELVNKFLSNDLLCVGTIEQSLEYADMDILRKLLKEKGLKAGGKRINLAQRIIQNYTHTELESADIPKRFILTDAGEQVIDKNQALLLYIKAFGSTCILNQDEIISCQRSYPADNEYDILIRLFKEKADKEKRIGSKRVLLAFLQRVYSMKHDDVLAQELEPSIKELDRLLEEEREQEARKLDAVLGMSYEERQRLQQDTIDVMDDEWEKELNEKNKAKAGIEEAFL